MARSKGAASGSKKSRAALRENTAAGKTARNIAAQKRVKATTTSFSPTTEGASASALNLPPDTSAASSSVSLPELAAQPGAMPLSASELAAMVAAVTPSTPKSDLEATVPQMLAAPAEVEPERRPWSKIPDDQKHLPAASIEKLRASPTLDVTTEVAAAATVPAKEPAPNETAPKVIISRYLAPPPPTELVRIPAAVQAKAAPRRRDASAWMPVGLLVALVVGLATWRIVRTPPGVPPVQHAQGLAQNAMTQAPPEVVRANVPASEPTVAVAPKPMPEPTIAPEPEPTIALAPIPTEPKPEPIATKPEPTVAPEPVATKPEPEPEPSVAVAPPVGPMTVSPTAPPTRATPTVTIAKNTRAQKYDNVPPRAAPWHTNVPPLAADKPVAEAYVAPPKNTYDDKPPLAAKGMAAEVVKAEKKVKDYDSVPPVAAADANKPRVLVMSQPPGAMVLVAGREVGQTPVTIKLEGNGDAPVVVRAAGYQPETMVLQRLLSKRSVTIVLSPTN